MDYYSYHPTVSLERPVVLAGFFGMELGIVAGVISQRTGVSVVELERWIEHEAGKSVSELVLLEGERALRQRELPMLKRALKDTPPPLVTLSDATLTEYDARRLVMVDTKLIYLKADLEDLYQRILRGLEASPGCYWPWVLQPPQSPKDLEALFQDRRAGYESAHLTLDVTGKHPNAIAELVMGHLEG